jgi:hypothetical protein
MRSDLKRLIGVEVLALVVVFACVFGLQVLGDTSMVQPVVEEVPAWLKIVMDFITGIPYVGPVVLTALKWMGVVAAVMTGAATLIGSVAKALSALGTAMGFVKFSESVDAALAKVWPYIAWLSMYNVQKPKP